MTSRPIAFHGHDHRECRDQTLGAVEAACVERGLRLTPVRRRVLEILLEEHRAVRAYEVLRRLTAAGATPQPPVAYRALDFLVANGFAHRVEKLNAYVACAEPGVRHAAAILICRDCGVVAEVEAVGLADGIAEAAEAAGFSVDRAVVELEGHCSRCRIAES